MFSLSPPVLLERLMHLVVMVLSLTVHEWAHAWSAYRLGDDTAAREGRLTLNPIVHMDPIGTFALPLLGVAFGWAKPVPVNPARFRREISMSAGMAITALAGPLSNLLIVVVGAVAYGLAWRFGAIGPRPAAIKTFLSQVMMLNVNLALFNLIPVPPLDGSRIVDHFLPYRLRPAWERFAQYSQYALLAVMFFGAFLIAAPAAFAFDLIEGLIATVAGV